MIPDREFISNAAEAAFVPESCISDRVYDGGSNHRVFVGRLAMFEVMQSNVQTFLASSMISIIPRNLHQQTFALRRTSLLCRCRNRDALLVPGICMQRVPGNRHRCRVKEAEEGMIHRARRSPRAKVT